MDLPINYHEAHWTVRKQAREQYIREQDGKCYHCNAPLNEEPPKEITKLPINWDLFPPNFLQYPVHLHHSHDTGLTIGAVHNYCNAVLWQYHGE